MSISLSIKKEKIDFVRSKFLLLATEKWVIIFAVAAAAVATWYSYVHQYIIAYGDAESHLNIAKRVVDSLTPGFAQLGGIWLPLPHLLLAPLVYFNPLWRTGLAGSIVSGVAFVVSALYIFKLTKLLTKSRMPAFFAALVFILNPNVLYLQSTPMTELTLIVFFLLSSYYFVRFIRHQSQLLHLLLAALFGFCAALSRYDGWFLVTIEAVIVALLYLPWRTIPKSFSEMKEQFNVNRWHKLEGRLILFCTLAFFGIMLWFLWGYLILGDPLYFTHSAFSAKSQQSSWLARGELPAYKNIFESFIYYFVTSMGNVGVLVFLLALGGCAFYIFNKKDKNRFYVLLILLVPFIFNVVTLYMGQSVIFIPSLTPPSFEWRLFNVRYGVMMVPFAAVCAGYLFYKSKVLGRFAIVSLVLAQLALFAIGYSPILTLADGTIGLSAAKSPDAQTWLSKNYDHGLVLIDDYARTLSVLRSGVPMKDVIYIGNKPYWDDSLKHPESYATWIVMQRNDEVWKNINDNLSVQGDLYKYFEKAYTSPDILIFKRNSTPDQSKN